MSGVRKKQEDKNLKIIKELLTFENNKYCFDCNQRGPTYVNITIGSFVCTSCGGALRKYNHRVKSISMSNFNQTEMDILKKRGNNICKKIYYGLCESNCPPEVDLKNGMLDSHLRAKYEQKKWYLEPTAKLEEETIKQNQAIFDKVEIPAPKLVKSYTVNSSTNIIIEPPRPSGGKLSLTKVNRSSIDVAEMPSSLGATVSQHRSSLDVTNTIDPSKLSGGSVVKLPMPNDHKLLTKHSNSDPKTNQTEQSPFGDNFQFSPPISKSQTMNFSMPPLLPTQPMAQSNHSSTSQAHIGERKGSDRYAALAELDDLFSTADISKQSATHTSLNPANNNHPWYSTNSHINTEVASHHTSLSNPFSSSTYQMPTSSFNPFNAINPQPAPAPPSSSSSSSSNWPGSTVPVSHSSANPFLNKTSVNNSTNPFL